MTGKKSSSAEESWRASLRVMLAGLLISPFLIWLLQIQNWSFPSAGEWLPAVQIAAWQALLSSVFSMAGGFLLFRAAQGFEGRLPRRLVEMNLLLPNVVPPLFTVMGAMMLGSLVTMFPFGLSAVVAVHALINSGLVAVALDRVSQAKIVGLGESALVMGASPHRFWWKVAWPALKGDLACIFLFIFSLCFTSFSIPLLLSGERAVSLEVAIYDYVRIDGRWDKAVILAALQALALLLLAALLPRPFWPPRAGRARVNLLALPFGRSIVFAPTLMIFFGWILGLSGSLNLRLEPAVQEALYEASLTSLLLGLTVGFLHLVFFMVVAYVTPHRELAKFLNGYLAPSPVITGFALILIPVEGETLDFLKLCLALTLISFPLLYRWMVHSVLSGLQPQVEVARTLGADWSQVLFDVVWPQAGPQLIRASGLAAVWAVGDFALSGLLLGDSVTLPLLIEDLLNRYRIEAAYLVLVPLMLLSVLVYGLFMGASRYVHR